MTISDRALRAFIALAEVRQFTVAAEQCHMTQSALSQLIARMEEGFGVRLFERGRRGISVTTEGERLLVSARRVVKELEAAQGDLRAIASLEVGQVALAVLPSLAAYWLPGALRPFREKHGRVRVNLFDVSSARCSEMTRQGLVDFSISSQPGLHQEIDSQVLFEEPMYVAYPAGHKMRRARELRLSDLRGLTFIHLHSTHMMLVHTCGEYAPARRVLEDAGTVDSGLEVEQLATQAGLVAAGFGACLAPACSLPQFQRPEIVTRRLAVREMARPIYVSRRKAATLPVAASALLEAVQAHAASAVTLG